MTVALLGESQYLESSAMSSTSTASSSADCCCGTRPVVTLVTRGSPNNILLNYIVPQTHRSTTNRRTKHSHPTPQYTKHLTTITSLWKPLIVKLSSVCASVQNVINSSLMKVNCCNYIYETYVRVCFSWRYFNVICIL